MRGVLERRGWAIEDVLVVLFEQTCTDEDLGWRHVRSTLRIIAQ